MVPSYAGSDPDKSEHSDQIVIVVTLEIGNDTMSVVMRLPVSFRYAAKNAACAAFCAKPHCLYRFS